MERGREKGREGGRSNRRERNETHTNDIQHVLKN